MGKWLIKNGLIWDKTGFVKNREKEIVVPDENDRTLDLLPTDLIVPGLIDCHLHLWGPKSPIGVNGSLLYREGIIACTDAGTYGYRDWENANRFWEDTEKMTVKSYLSVLPKGLVEYPVQPVDPDAIKTDDLTAVAKAAPQERFMGYKVPIGWKDLATDRKMMRITREAADATGHPIMVHVSGAYMPLDEIVSFLRAGDVISHIYSGNQGREVLDGSSAARDTFFRAKASGIYMDVAFGIERHLSWKVFCREWSHGVQFDTISTDAANFSYKNPDYPVNDLYTLLSAFYAAGVGLDELFNAVITKPAALMHIDCDDSGRVLVIGQENTAARSFSMEKDLLTGSTRFVPKLFIDGGKVIREQREVCMREEPLQQVR